MARLNKACVCKVPILIKGVDPSVTLLGRGREVKFKERGLAVNTLEEDDGTSIGLSEIPLRDTYADTQTPSL